VRFLGLSEAAPTTVRRAAKVHPIARCNPNTRSGPEITKVKSFRHAANWASGLWRISPLGRGFLTGKLRNPEKLDAVIIGALLRDFGARTSSGTPSWSTESRKLLARKIAPQPNSLLLGSWPREAISFDRRHQAPHISRRKCRIGPRYSTPRNLARIDQELPSGMVPATGTIQSNGPSQPLSAHKPRIYTPS